MPGGKKCAFVSCTSSKTLYSRLRFFKFPINNPYICDIWVVNCANEQLIDLSPSALASRLVCEKHFEKHCYNNTSRSSKLRKTAVPTLFCPDSEEQEPSSSSENVHTTMAAPSALDPDDPQPPLTWPRQQRSISIEADTSHYPLPALFDDLPSTLPPTPSPPPFDELPSTLPPISSPPPPPPPALFDELPSTLSPIPSPPPPSPPFTERMESSQRGRYNSQLRALLTPQPLQLEFQKAAEKKDKESQRLLISNEEEVGSGNEQPSAEKPISDLEPVTFVQVSSIKEEPLDIDHVEDEENQLDLFSGIEDPKPPVLEIDSCQPEVSTPRTYTKSIVATHTVTQPSTTSETVSQVSKEKDDDDFKDLKAVVKKLESISEKLTTSRLDDDYEQFGKYLGTLLRGVPKKKFLKLKIKLITDVMQARMSSESGSINVAGKAVGSVKSSNVPSAVNVYTRPTTPCASATSDKDIRSSDRRVAYSSNPVQLQNLPSSVMMPAGPKSPLMNVCYPASISHTSTVYVPLTLAMAPSKPTNLAGSQNTFIQNVPSLSLLPSKTIPTASIVSQPHNKLTKEDENKADTRDLDGGAHSQQLSKTATSTGIGSQLHATKPIKVYPSKTNIRNNNGGSPSQQHPKTASSSDTASEADSTHTEGFTSTADIRSDQGDTPLQEQSRTVSSDVSASQTDSKHIKGYPSKADIREDDDGRSTPPGIKEEISHWCDEDDIQMDIEEGKELENIKQDLDPLGSDFQDQASPQHDAVTLEPPDPGEIGNTGETSTNDPETRRFYCELCPSSNINTSFFSSNQLKMHFRTVHPGSCLRFKSAHSGGDEKSSKRKCLEDSSTES